MPNAKRLFATLQETQVPASIVDVRLPGQPLVFVNEAFESLTGFSKEEIIGRNCRFLQAGEPNDIARKKITQLMAEAGEGQVILRNKTKDGTAFQNLLLLYPMFSDEGELTHFFGSQFDISRQSVDERLEGHTKQLAGALGQIRQSFGFDAVRACNNIADAAFAVLNQRRAELGGVWY